MKRISILCAIGVVLMAPRAYTNITSRRRLLSLILSVTTLLAVLPAQGQTTRVTSRSLIQLPGAQGMGNAQVALPTQQSAFFYNPAHIAHSSFHLTIVGTRVSMSNNVPDQIRFFNNELKPAIDEGIDNLDNEELQDLYQSTLDTGRALSFLHADILAPSVGVSIGPVGIGAGIFGSTSIQYNFPDAGGGLPLVNIYGVADGIGVLSTGLDLSRFGVDGLSLGVTAKYTSRFLTFKNKPLDAISSDEPFYILNANRMSFDAGIQYELPVLTYFPGSFHVGLALYDLAGSQYSFSHYDTLGDAGSEGDLTTTLHAANQLFAATPSFRLGVAYSIPNIPFKLLDETGVTLDYLGSNNTAIDQAFFARLRMGVQARVKFFSLRTGLNQGYPSVGGGLSLGFVDIDYAYFGREEGRFPGQLPSWHHTAQIRFGI